MERIGKPPGFDGCNFMTPHAVEYWRLADGRLVAEVSRGRGGLDGGPDIFGVTVRPADGTPAPLDWNGTISRCFNAQPTEDGRLAAARAHLRGIERTADALLGTLSGEVEART